MNDRFIRRLSGIKLDLSCLENSLRKEFESEPYCDVIACLLFLTENANRELSLIVRAAKIKKYKKEKEKQNGHGQ